jgi:hypothetical protein
MQNFDKKVKNLFNLYMYKFKEFDYESIKLKIYFISPDNRHIYISIDNICNGDGNYRCEVGDLFLDVSKNKVFEDTPNEIAYFTKDEFTKLKKIYEKTPKWSNKLIKDIISITDKLDLVN